MTVTVKHAHQTALPNDGSKDVSATAWNEAHTLTGLGTAAEADTGTSGAKVPLLDGANTWSAQQTFAYGTITTSQPLTVTQTWNAAGVTFEAWVLDLTSTASAAASLAMNVKVGGVSIFSMSKLGALTATNNFTGTNAGANFIWAGAVSFTGTTFAGNNACALYSFKRNVIAEPATRSLTNRTQYVVTNEGATSKPVLTLLTAVAGDHVEFAVNDADGIRIVANAGDTIRVRDKVTAAAGYIESTTIGSIVRLVALNATEWFAMEIGGIWTDGTFTYDDTGLTTP